jgi:hypothetical protein
MSHLVDLSNYPHDKKFTPAMCGLTNIQNPSIWIVGTDVAGEFTWGKQGIKSIAGEAIVVEIEAFVDATIPLTVTGALDIPLTFAIWVY